MRCQTKNCGVLRRPNCVPDVYCCLHSIHARHTYIHEYKIKFAFLRFTQPLIPILREDHLMTLGLNHTTNNEAIGFIIFDEKNSASP